MRFKVLVVDDHAGFRAFARVVLDGGRFDVVGEAADGASALEAAAGLAPDVVVLDIQLPDIDGFEVTERLSRSAAAPTIVLVSTRDISTYRRRLARSAARGFIPKHELSGPALARLVT